jgi:aryl-alcohol dehydrogenase-like predicted oxidoreductase
MTIVEVLPATNRMNSGRLALGTVQFGLSYGVANQQGQTSLDVARQMVRFAANIGVNTLDTAIGYGESEQVLGKIDVSDFNVVTKLLPLPKSVRDVDSWAFCEAEASLKRLKLDRLHGLLLHRSSDLHDARGTALYAAMQKLKLKGYVKKIGISIYSPAELDACFGKFELDLIQAPFNLVDHRLFTSGWLQRLKANSCEVHVRSAFLQGLLLMSRSAIPDKFSQWSSIWNNWHQWLRQHDADAVRACLAYPLSFPQIDRIIVGANDLEQLRQIAIAVGHTIDYQFPNLACNEENLINPARWSDL